MCKQNPKVIEVRIRVRLGFGVFLVVVLWGFMCLLFSLAHLNVKKKETGEH